MDVEFETVIVDDLGSKVGEGIDVGFFFTPGTGQ